MVIQQTGQDVSGDDQTDTPLQARRRLRPLTCGFFEPEVGFEPTTFRLRVEEHSSSGCQRVPSWLLRSVGSSSQYGPDLRSNGWWNDHGNDRPFQDSTVT
jgi:hypothetical protein